MLRLSYGNAVTGASRFERPGLQDKLMRMLTQGAGIKMFGLRRIGKSTLRLYATEQLELQDRPVVFVDSQGLRSLSDLLARIFTGMPRQDGFMNRAIGFLSSGPAQAALQAVAAGSDKEETVLSAYWQTVSDAIRKALEAEGVKPILIIDEFTYLLGNMLAAEKGREEVDKLLAALREWRASGMTMLLTGSIGLTALARTHSLTAEHLNDLQPFVVPELTLEEARAFVREATETPSEGRWTEAHTEAFLACSGVLYPCFLVAGLLEIGILSPPDPSAFESIFDARVRPELHADFYNQFDRRFKAYGDLPGDEQAKLILPALKEIMSHDGACPHEAILCEAPFTGVDLSMALTMLWEDGFVHFSEDSEGERRWRPASNLARMWWKRSKLA